VDSNRYLVVINIKGPEATKSIVDFIVIHEFSLCRETTIPKIKTSSAHRTSFGTFLSLNHLGMRTRTTMAKGSMQDNKMEACLAMGGQLCIAATEKMTIKRVEHRKTLKAQLS
jgi:hypothetical protein